MKQNVWNKVTIKKFHVKHFKVEIEIKKCYNTKVSNNGEYEIQKMKGPSNGKNYSGCKSKRWCW